MRTRSQDLESAILGEVNHESDQAEDLLFASPLVGLGQTQRRHALYSIPVYGGGVGVWNDPQGRGRIESHPTLGYALPRIVTGDSANNTASFHWVMNAGRRVQYNASYPIIRSNTPISFSAWCRPTNVSGVGNPQGTVFGCVRTVAINQTFAWRLGVTTAGIARAQIASSASTATAASASSAVVNNRDYHLVGTYDRQFLNFYLNGVLQQSTATTLTFENTAGYCYTAGGNPQNLGNQENLIGWIWDLRIYSRILDRAQILEMYENPWDLYVPSKSIVRFQFGSIVTQSVTDAFVVDQVVRANKSFTLSMLQTITTAQVIVAPADRPQSLTQGVILSQSLARNFVATVSQGVTVTDDIDFLRGLVYSRSVTQSFATYQDVSRRLDKLMTVTQGITMSDLPQSDLTTVRHTFTISQTIVVNKIITLRLTQNLTTTQDPFVNSPRLFALFDNVTATQTATGRNSTNRQVYAQSFVVTQSQTGRIGTFRVTVSQSFTTSQQLFRRDAIIRVTLVDSTTFTQRVNTLWPKRVEQDINLLESIVRNRHVYRTWSIEVSVTHDFEKQRYIPRSIATILVTEDTLDRQVIWTRSVGESLNEQSDIIVSARFAPPAFYLPAISGGPPAFGSSTPRRGPITGVVPVADLVRLDSGSSVILLPVPQLQNTLGDAAEITTKRTISGLPLSYKKTTGQQIFTYTFWLDLVKAYELRDWIKANGAKVITLTNWRGEAWRGNITTDQPQLTSETLRKGSGLEKVVVTLSFQGVKLYG
jgi:hypothetical protein